MMPDHRCHVQHRTTTKFYCVPFKELVAFGALGKMPVIWGMTPPGDAGGNFLAERRVKPRDVTATVTLFLLFAVTLPVAEDSVLSPKPLPAWALWYTGLEFSNTASISLLYRGEARGVPSSGGSKI